MQKISGFSLLDLTIVITTVAILVQLSAPAFEEWQAKEQEVVLFEDMMKKHVGAHAYIFPVDEESVSCIKLEGFPTSERLCIATINHVIINKRSTVIAVCSQLDGLCIEAS